MPESVVLSLHAPARRKLYRCVKVSASNGIVQYQSLNTRGDNDYLVKLTPAEAREIAAMLVLAAEDAEAHGDPLMQAALAQLRARARVG